MAITITPRVTAATVLSTGQMEITGSAGLEINPSGGSDDSKIQFQLQGADHFTLGVDQSVTNDPLTLVRGTNLAANKIWSVADNADLFNVHSATNVIGALTVGVDDTGHDVKFFGATASRYMLWDESEDYLIFPDNVKAVFGTGGDLSIYHDSNHSYISDQGTGNIAILANDFQVNNAANNANMISATQGGAVALNHNGSTKLATHASGVEITGSLEVATIDFTDGDLAMTIADGGGVAFAQITTTPSIELRSASGTPYVDFTNHATDDYDARIILTSDSVLSVHGATLEVNGDLKATGDIYSTGDYFYNYIADDAYGGYTLRNDTLNATHILWELNKRNTNEDAWLIAYNGTAWKNIMKWDWTDASTRIPDGRLFLGEANTDDNATIIFDGHEVDFHIGLDDDVNRLVIGTGATLGSNTAMRISSTGNTTFDGNVVIEHTGSSSPTLALKNFNADNTSSYFDIWKVGGSPADNDYLGIQRWIGKNDADQDVVYATMYATSLDVTDSTEDGGIIWQAMREGTNRTTLQVSWGGVYLYHTGNVVARTGSQGLWIGNGQDTEDYSIVWDGHGIDFYIGLDDGTDDLYIGTGSTIGSNGAMIIDGSRNTTFGGNVVLSDGANLNISTPLLAGTDHTTTGMTAQMLAGGAIGAFDLVCIHTTTQEIVVADASAYATARVIGIAPVAISDTATGTVLLHGFIRDDTWNWTTGATLYLSETAGDLTATAPTTSGAFVVAIGVALEPDVVYINPSPAVIEVA